MADEEILGAASQIRLDRGPFLSVHHKSGATAVAHTEGKEIVDGNGKKLLLRGTNLGNWLVPEGYMWHLNNGGPESPREIEALITELVGPHLRAGARSSSSASCPGPPPKRLLVSRCGPTKR
jgi:hypothetical protein